MTPATTPNPMAARVTSDANARRISTLVISSPPKMTSRRSGPSLGSRARATAAVNAGYITSPTNASNLACCAPGRSSFDAKPSTGAPNPKSARRPAASPVSGLNVVSVYAYTPSPARRAATRAASPNEPPLAPEAASKNRGTTEFAGWHPFSNVPSSLRPCQQKRSYPGRDCNSFSRRRAALRCGAVSTLRPSGTVA